MDEESDDCEDGHVWIEYEEYPYEYYCHFCGVDYED